MGSFGIFRDSEGFCRIFIILLSHFSKVLRDPLGFLGILWDSLGFLGILWDFHNFIIPFFEGTAGSFGILRDSEGFCGIFIILLSHFSKILRDSLGFLRIFRDSLKLSYFNIPFVEAPLETFGIIWDS